MKIKRIMALATALLMCTTTAFAHSGRTDSRGGHRDNKNVSGLGPYHYHCGGYPAHLHTNGVCPYKGGGSVSSSSSSSASSAKSIYVDPNRNNVYLMHTMPQMTVGESFTADAVSNNSAAITWYSSDSSIASVDSNGTVTAIAPGTAVITASNGYKSQSYTVTCKGYMSYTNTKAEIDGNAIQAYKYNSDIYVLCSDLSGYGFNASFTSGEEGSRVTISESGEAPVPKEVISYPDGKIAYEVLPTAINVICSGDEAYSKSANGDGRMFVAFSDLDAFGLVSFDYTTNTISLTTGEPEVIDVSDGTIYNSSSYAYSNQALLDELFNQ